MNASTRDDRRIIKSMRTLGAVIIRHRPVTIECDANLTPLDLLELLAIQLGSISMCEDNAMPNTAA